MKHLIDAKTFTAYNEWINWLAHEKNYARNTVEAYQSDVIIFFTFMHKHLGEIVSWSFLKNDVSVQDLRSWLVQQRTQNYSPTSSRRMLSSVRSFFGFLFKNYDIDIKAFTLLHTPRKQKTLPKSLTQEEALFSLEQIDELSDEYWVGLRDKALLLLMYGCGLRISEALSLRKKDFNHNDYLIVLGKRNKERKVPLLEQVHNAVKDYIAACPYAITSDGTLFYSLTGKILSRNNFSKQLQKLRHLYNLPDHASAHAFRHSFASHLLQNNGDLRTIQELLGHQNLSSTQIYTSIDTKRLLSVYENAHPRDKTKI